MSIYTAVSTISPLGPVGVDVWQLAKTSAFVE